MPRAPSLRLPPPRSLRAGVGLVLAALGWAGSAAAQDTAGGRGPEGDSGPTFAATLDSIARLDDLLAFLEAGIQDASGADQDQLRRRRDVRSAERRGLLLRLAERLPAAESGAVDGPSSGSRAVVDSLLAADTRARERRLQELVRRSSALRAELAGLEGPERARLEPVARAVEEEILVALEDIARSLEVRESVGADVSEAARVFESDLRLRSELLSARLADARSDLQAVRERVQGGESDLESDLPALEARIRTTAASLGSVLGLMEAREMPTADLRRDLLLSTGDLSADNVSLDVVQGLIGQWWEDATTWARGNGANLAFKALLFLLTLALFWILARLIRSVLLRGLDASPLEMSGLLRTFILRWTTRVVMLTGLLIALSQVGVQLGPVLAGVGIAGFIVGFALQDTLANFAAGVMILLYRPFDEGDLVSVGGVTGTVSDMSLVSTTIHSLDNQSYVVPNTMIWGDVIQNHTALATRRVDLSFRIGYEEDIGRALEVLDGVLRSHELVLDDPEPVVRVGAWGEYAVELLARPWCHTRDYWEVSWSLTRQVKEAFDEAGIRIPLGEHADGDEGPLPGDRRAPGADSSVATATGVGD